MKHYQNKADALFGAVLLLSGLVCVLIILATAANEITTRMAHPDWEISYLWVGKIGYLLYAAMLTSVIITRHQLMRDGVRLWAYVTLTVTTILALLLSFVWFQDPMHDIALLFGSHGRWGCIDFNSDGSPVYFIRGDTVPWLLFAPILISIPTHWAWTKIRRAQSKLSKTVP